MSDRNRDLWEMKNYPAYRGDEPYVYLCLAPWELEEGLTTLRVLNELGCRVLYDEQLLTGRPWTGEICDAIEGCAVFWEISLPDYRFSLRKELAGEFAGKLEKKKVTAHAYPPENDRSYQTDSFFYCLPEDPAFPDLCRRALESAGYVSAEQADPAPTHWDLMLDYYKTKKDWDRKFGGLRAQTLNLRTHESYGYLGHYARSDEDVYAAVRYGKTELYYLSRRSSEDDYKPTREDRAFTEMIRKLDGKASARLEREYETAPDVSGPGRPFPRGYPYKDEFEYLSSGDD